MFRKLQRKNNTSRSSESKSEMNKIISGFVLTLISALITLPLFVLLYRYVPDIIIPAGKGVRIDHVLLFAIIFIVVRLLTGLTRYFFYGLTLLVLILLTAGQISGKYGFTHVFSMYRDLLGNMGRNPVSIPFMGHVYKTIPDADAIRAAIDYGNKDVRSFAVSASLKYFKSENTYPEKAVLIKCFSIFKVMSSWEYVSDPRGEEYFASASESVSLMSGDCDDYSILMAAAIRAIGGEVRLVRTPGHLFPEVKAGNTHDLPVLIDLIKNRLFYRESIGVPIYYHTDEWDNIWLNFDYTNLYPGGSFMSNDVIGIMEI
jgi:hypothetical protein